MVVAGFHWVGRIVEWELVLAAAAYTDSAVVVDCFVADKVAAAGIGLGRTEEGIDPAEVVGPNNWQAARSSGSNMDLVEVVGHSVAELDLVEVAHSRAVAVDPEEELIRSLDAVAVLEVARMDSGEAVGTDQGHSLDFGFVVDIARMAVYLADHRVKHEHQLDSRRTENNKRQASVEHQEPGVARQVEQ